MRRITRGLAVPARGRSRLAPCAVQVGLLVIGTVVVVVVAGAETFWVCVPAALLACAVVPNRRGAVAGAVAIVAAAVTATYAPAAAGTAPPVLVALLVPAVSVAVLVALRGRLERERDVMREFALRDPLTGLANRRSLQVRAEYEITRHTRGRGAFAVVMLDLDGFKVLNDRFGHAAGDDLLRDVAGALERALRAPDTVARLGGDEFCVLAPETDEAGTDRLAARIATAVRGVSAGSNHVRATLGVAMFPADGESVAQLLEAADQRLIASKRERKRRRDDRLAA